MLNNKIVQNIVSAIVVLTGTCFVVLLYFYLKPKDIYIDETKYIVNWDVNNSNKVEKFVPTFEEIKHTPTPTIEATKTSEVLTAWIETNDENLINYAASSIDSNTWPVYTNWTLEGVPFADMLAPDSTEVYNANTKTYMKYQTLGYDSWNRQGHLVRQKEAYTGKHYIRMIDGRMLIALGQYYSSTIGTYIDIELEDGTILACILGDVKADKDTDSLRQYCIHDYSVLEFIVDSQGEDSSDYSRIKSLEPIYGLGNFSRVPELSSPVKSIRVYDKVYDIDMSDLSNDNPDTNDTRRR